MPVFLVGHVTKDGSVAGPRVLEHMVDAVLYLEGERYQHYRVLRAAKNRFGSTHELGVFEMTDHGLIEVANPSAAFLAESRSRAPGSAVVASLEGTRPLLVEVQALVAPSVHGSPRRTVSRLDTSGLLEPVARSARPSSRAQPRQPRRLRQRSRRPDRRGAGDRPATGDGARIVPCATGRSWPGTVLCGEIGLTGELRPIGGLARRLREAARLGFARAIVPLRAGRTDDGLDGIALEIIRVGTLREAIAAALMTERGPARPEHLPFPWEAPRI